MIEQIQKWLAAALFRRLSPTARVTLVRDFSSVDDLAKNLPLYMLKPLIFDAAKRTGIMSIGVLGDYGPIEGSARDRVIMRQYVTTGTWSPEFQDEIISRIFQVAGGTFVDVGANIGLTSIPTARRFGARCIAIEPDPHNLRYLRNNIELNGLQELIRVIHSAASDTAGELDFELSPDNLGDHRIRRAGVAPLVASAQDEASRQVIQVPAKPLDELLAEFELTHPLVVKIDVQGAEPLVFKGGKETLAACDCVVVEYSPYTLARAGFTPADFFSELPAFKLAEIHSFDLKALNRPTRPFESKDELRSFCERLDPKPNPDIYFDLVLFRN